ncbi:MAG TPA: hypothetical protein VG963_29270 [Polyangiaceae bacterium]|nr:hypothetical protein [Polyangiaceae bacterium]
MAAKLTGIPARSGEPAEDFSPLRLMRVFLQSEFKHLMQAALVRNVVFAQFAINPWGYRTGPSTALTWQALTALEGSCVVHIVECLRNKLYKGHVPESVEEKLSHLEGHRDVVSHPFVTREEDWKHPRMKEFEAAGRRHESRVPLVLDLQRALNDELTSEGIDPLPEFYVTTEMAQLLRLIWRECLRPSNVSSIPDDAGLIALLQGCRDKALQSCQDRADGKPAPPVPETELDRMWAAKRRGEEVSWPVDDG